MIEVLAALPPWLVLLVTCAVVATGPAVLAGVVLPSVASVVLTGSSPGSTSSPSGWWWSWSPPRPPAVTALLIGTAWSELLLVAWREAVTRGPGAPVPPAAVRAPAQVHRLRAPRPRRTP